MDGDTTKIIGIAVACVGALVYTNQKLFSLLVLLSEKIDKLGDKIDKLAEKLNY